MDVLLELHRAANSSQHMLLQLELVGPRGFEPPTTWSQTRCATRLRYGPTMPERSVWRDRRNGRSEFRLAVPCRFLVALAPMPSALSGQVKSARKGSRSRGSGVHSAGESADEGFGCSDWCPIDAQCQP